MTSEKEKAAKDFAVEFHIEYGNREAEDEVIAEAIYLLERGFLAGWNERDKEVAELKKQLRAVVIQNEGNHRKAVTVDKSGYARAKKAIALLQAENERLVQECQHCGYYSQKKRDKHPEQEAKR